MNSLDVFVIKGFTVDWREGGGGGVPPLYGFAVNGIVIHGPSQIFPGLLIERIRPLTSIEDF